METGGALSTSGAFVAQSSTHIRARPGATLRLEGGMEVADNSTVEVDGAALTAGTLIVNRGSFTTSGANVTITTLTVSNGSGWIFVNTSATVAQDVAVSGSTVQACSLVLSSAVCVLCDTPSLVQHLAQGVAALLDHCEPLTQSTMAATTQPPVFH